MTEDEQDKFLEEFFSEENQIRIFNEAVEEALKRMADQGLDAYTTKDGWIVRIKPDGRIERVRKFKS